MLQEKIVKDYVVCTHSFLLFKYMSSLFIQRENVGLQVSAQAEIKITAYNLCCIDPSLFPTVKKLVFMNIYFNIVIELN